MTKKSFVPGLIAVAVVVLIVLNVQAVSAIGFEPPPPSSVPAAGSWSWNNDDVIGTTIPQYQLAPTDDDDYALLQSEGIHLSGATHLCHPYPGGQSGWNAEIRVLTNTGWQPVPTVNAWVPDEEGKYMTCAQANYSGTYAVFGYWVRPDGWMQCPVAGFGTYIAPVTQISIIDNDGVHVGVSCGAGGSIVTEPPLTDQSTIDNISQLMYCCNNSIYFSDNFDAGPSQQ